MIINLVADIEIEVDGDLSKEKAIKIFFREGRIEGVLSEDYDAEDCGGPHDWAILVNSWSGREV